MRYALIGCGRISTNHIKAAVNNNLEIVAVCDIAPEHMVLRNIQFQIYRGGPVGQKAVLGGCQKNGIGAMFGNGCKFTGNPGIPLVHPIAVFRSDTIPCVQFLFVETIGACFHQFPQRLRRQTGPQCVGTHKIILPGKFDSAIDLLG